jgi:hypothetical protein
VKVFTDSLHEAQPTIEFLKEGFLLPSLFFRCISAVRVVLKNTKKLVEVDVELILLISWVLVGSMLIGWRIYSKRKRK